MSLSCNYRVGVYGNRGRYFIRATRNGTNYWPPSIQDQREIITLRYRKPDAFSEKEFIHIIHC